MATVSRFLTTQDSLMQIDASNEVLPNSQFVEVVPAAAYDALLKELNDLKAAPSGFVMIPVKPPKALLVSMAIRSDHGLGVPGYYDQKILGGNGVSHEKQFEAAIREMAQVYEEVTGEGFYSQSREQQYLDIADQTAQLPKRQD